MAGVGERELLQQYPKQLDCDRIGSDDSSIVMLEQRGRKAVKRIAFKLTVQQPNARPIDALHLSSIYIDFKRTRFSRNRALALTSSRLRNHFRMAKAAVVLCSL